MGWSNGFSTDETSSPLYNAERPYVPPNRPFQFPINTKTYPEDIQCHFGRLRELSNNCVIEEIIPESLGNLYESIPIIDTISSGSQLSSIMDEEIVLEGTELTTYCPPLSSKICHVQKSPLTYSAVLQSSLPHTQVKSTTTFQLILHELPINNFEFGQCYEYHESSSSDESSPHFHLNQRISKKHN